MDLKSVTKFAIQAHKDANNKYDDKDYYTHVEMVEDNIEKYGTVFLKYSDYVKACAGASSHDLIEDAGLTFNNIKEATSTPVAHIVLAVTDVHEENRLLRHLATMGKTVKNYVAIIVKMADILANAKYSKRSGSSMYKKYVAEYEYRRPIFKMALKWYTEYLDQDVLENFWAELDEIHGWKKQV